MSFIQNKNRAKNYYLSFLFFILALFSKSSAVTLPLIFLLCDYFIKAKISKKDLLNKIPFFILSIIFGIITLKGRVDTTNVANIIQTYGMFDRIIFIIYSLTFYILNVLLPLTMSKYHPYPETEGGMLPIVYYVMPFILGGIIFLIIKVKRCKREIIFGSLFFLISISVMIELIPVGISIVKQRYNYLSCVGLYFAFFTFLFTYFDKNHRVKTFISVGLVLLSISFVALSFGRAQTWKNSISLWNDAIKKYPRCYLAYEDRAVYYSNTGSIDNAIDDFTKAIEIKIDFSDAYYNRGNAYMKKGLNDKAIEDFSNAIKYAPDYAKAYNNRGYIYDNHRYYDKAVADYSKALQIDSAFPKAYNNLEMVYLKQGLYDRVISDYTKTIKSNPNDTAAYCNRGMAFMNKKLYDQAIEDFTKVIILKPDFVDAFYNRGIVYNDQSLFDKAVEDFTKAIVLKPDYATAFNSRAFAYLGKNSRDKACEDFEKAIELGSVEAKNNLMKYCK